MLHIIGDIDIDECSLNITSHDCDQVCINTNGGHYCSCEEGYALKEDRRSCEGMHVFTHFMKLFSAACMYDYKNPAQK